MSRLISVEGLIARLRKAHTDYVAVALDTASPENAAYEYGYKVGYSRGMQAAEQQLNQLLKEEIDGHRPEQHPQQAAASAYR